MNIRAMKVGAVYVASTLVNGRYQDAMSGTTFKVKVLSIGDTYETHSEFGYRGRKQRGATVEILETVRRRQYNDTPEEAATREPKKVRLPGMYDSVTIEEGNQVVIGGRAIFATEQEYDDRIAEQERQRKRREEQWEESRKKRREIVRWMRENGLAEWHKEQCPDYNDEEDNEIYLPRVAGDIPSWTAVIDALNRETANV